MVRRPTTDALEQRIAAIRRFTRFYTRQIGLLEEGLLASSFSMTEVRILWELAYRDGLTATLLRRDLGLDAGYLSRILSRFEETGLIARQVSPEDGRRNLLSLTNAGRRAFAPLDARSHDQIAALLSGLPETDQAELVEAVATVERLLGRAGQEPR
ncbi:MarR family winged helix-turn-helix transcriptional regulator [Phreatobacter stygius]|uniref:Winged helix-turn-helix transcriptional regulator n=1 Tax=Phreatobacter stygius TaxID=1940610 RepID=A0A4D7B9F2_9HYPH|nr:MarR family winged helix-turn-helix transcriptional regulator [Phreatobacter stygius]QCI64682.1 winged helix-turn-helix transcriptional regulator [Phreatobacter stygius]